MTDLSPRSGKRERDYRDRRSPTRMDRRSPPRRFDRDRSPPRKRRRDEFDRRDDFSRRRDPSPDRRRFDDRGKSGRDVEESPRRRKSANDPAPKFDGPLLSFKQFVESSDDRSSTAVLQKRYEDYKQEYDRKNFKTFFKNHKDEEWLREKYFPSLISESFKIQTANATEASTLFLEELKQGLFEGLSWDADAMEDLLKEEGPIEVEGHKKEDSHSITDGDIPISDGHMEDSHEQIIEEKNEEKKLEKEVAVQPQKKTPPCVQELFKIPTGQYTLQIDGIPPSITRTEIIEAITNNITASKAVHLFVGPPNPTKNFVRLAWAGFSSEEALEEALVKMKDVTIRDYTFSISRMEVSRHLRIVPALTSSPSRIHVDLETARKLVRAFDDHRGIDKNILLERISNIGGEEELVALEDKLLKLSEKSQLDLLIAYLQKVHCHWYYTAETHPSFESLVLVGGPVVRATTKHACNVTQDEQSWEKELDKQNKTKLAHLELTLKHLTGEALFESNLEEFFSEKVVKEADERFRCELCMKAFKAPVFVQKHIHNRHPETVNETREKAMEEQYFKNYFNDPNHIAPSMMFSFPDDKPPKKKSPERNRDEKHRKSPRELDKEHAEKSSKRSPPTLPRDRSPARDRRSPVSARTRDRSPQRDRSPMRDIRRSPPPPRDRSPPRERSPRGRPASPPRERSPRERSLSRERMRRNWSPVRRGGREGTGRGGRRGRQSGGRNGRKEDVNEEPADLKEKADPRRYVEYTDLDKPPEENVEIDYEKALAAFASGGL